jgi:ATP-dependent exoDNAse (exonuclease V) beta subunit
MINKEILISGVDYEEVVTSSLIMDFIDTIKALEILSEGIIWKGQLIDKIDAIFSENNQDGVCLSTIHKAKGLESDNVYILCPSLMPSKYAKKDWEKQAEENLIYVAFTRAKKTLNFISEDLFSPNLFSNENNVIMELEYQRIRMNNALKKNLQIEKCENYQPDKKLSKTVKSLLNTNNSKDASISGSRKNKIAGNKMAKFLK